MNLYFSVFFQCSIALLLGIKADEHQTEFLHNTDRPHTPICVRDEQVAFASLGNPDNYAIATSPRGTAFIARSSLPYAGLGAFAARHIERDTYFGPYGGYIHCDCTVNGTCQYAWTLTSTSGQMRYYIDAEDPRNSNWLRYINTPNTVSQLNLVGFQYYGKIIYKAVRDIEEGEELLVYYGDGYAKFLGINTTDFASCLFFKDLQQTYVEDDDESVFKCVGSEEADVHDTEHGEGEYGYVDGENGEFGYVEGEDGEYNYVEGEDGEYSYVEGQGDEYNYVDGEDGEYGYADGEDGYVDGEGGEFNYVEGEDGEFTYIDGEVDYIEDGEGEFNATENEH